MTSSSPYVRPKARLLQNLAFGIGVLKSEFVFCRSGAHLSQPARVGLSLPASCRSTQHDLRWYLRAKYDKEPRSSRQGAHCFEMVLIESTRIVTGGATPGLNELELVLSVGDSLPMT